MELFVKVLVCFLAGAGAGIGTGFAGMSAAAVIGPMLITFLDIPAYSAVGIGLASDVLASAVSAYTYKKNQNLDVKNGLVMMVFVLLFTMVGSFVASLVPNSTMGNFSVFMTMLLGVKFIVKPVMTTREAMEAIPRKTRMIKSVIGGIVIGFICGFVGAGGGMMMLLVLTTLLGYELKCAVGTSVFVMTFKLTSMWDVLIMKKYDKRRKIYAVLHRPRNGEYAVYHSDRGFGRRDLCPAQCVYENPLLFQRRKKREGERHQYPHCDLYRQQALLERVRTHLRRAGKTRSESGLSDGLSGRSCAGAGL